MTPEFVVSDHAIGGKLVVGKASITAEYKQLIDSGDPDARDEYRSTYAVTNGDRTIRISTNS